MRKKKKNNGVKHEPKVKSTVRPTEDNKPRYSFNGKHEWYGLQEGVML